MKIDASNCSRCRVKFTEDTPRKDATHKHDPSLQNCADDFECGRRITRQVRDLSKTLPVPLQFEELTAALCGVSCRNDEYIKGLELSMKTLNLSLDDARSQEQKTA
jgi:hypothetical protein